ncbi:beta strand repeat-containing protein, partial [Pseudotenacibaculum haliotis]
MKILLRAIITIAASLLFVSISYSQTAGLIYEGSTAGSPLDPNADGYTSQTSSGFPANQLPTDIFDILFSEIPYVAIPKVQTEPDSDLGPGPDCFYTDMVPAADGESTYYYNDGTNMLFRFRLGGTAPNSKGYSVLIDTDQKFGFEGPNRDPNAVVGNPGFEIEIILRTNFGVSVYNIDGLADGGTEIGTFNDRPYETFAQKSLALTTNCDDPDYFYDFYVPFADLTSLGGGVTLTSSTKVRMVTLTVINPNAAVGNNGISDLGGIDDTTGGLDDLTEEIIDNQTPTDGTTSDPPLPRADCPTVDAIVNGATSVSGTSTEVDGTIIEVFKNDVSIGTTTVSGGTWTLSPIAPSLVTDDVIKATATVPESAGTEKGTSIDNCDIETVTAVACTQSDTPVITTIGSNSGRNITGTTTEPVGNTIRVYLYDANGAVASMGSVSMPQDVVVDVGGTWEIGPSSGGYKVPSGYYSVSIENITAGECESDRTAPPFAYCRTGGGGDALSTTISITSPTTLLTSSSTLSGTFGASTSADVEVYKNNVATGLTTSVVSSTTWSIDISSLNLTVGDVLYVTSSDTGTPCVAESSTLTVVGKSLEPVVTGSYCVSGTVSEVSGTSSEIGATITVYSKATSGVTTSDTNEGTTTVAANGSWTLSGLSIASGRYIAATAKNGSELESDISNEILIQTKTAIGTLTITTPTITEGDASVSGTSSFADGTVIQLYLDGDFVSGATTTISSGDGSWTISSLDAATNPDGFDVLYTGATVSVTATEAGGSCESDQSSSKTVVCDPPSAFTISSLSSSTACEDSTISLTIDATETGVIYQVYDQDGNTIGPSKVGTGASMSISTDGLGTSVTSVEVRAFKIGVTCSTVTSTNTLGPITVNPAPSITLGANPSASFSAGAQTVNLTYSATTGSSLEYKIDYDDVAFTDVTYTTLPASPIVLDVPAGLAAGSYSATFTLREGTNSCEKSYPITITITDGTTPTITLTDTALEACPGDGNVNLAYSGTTNSPDQYSINFDTAAEAVGFRDVTNETLPSSPISVVVSSIATAGTYNAVLTVRNSGTGKISIEYAFSITIPDGGTIGSDQTISSGDDVAAFTEVAAPAGHVSAITYQWQRSTTSASSGFTNIGGATSATYDEGTITQTTYYKRIATSTINGSSCSIESNVITVTVSVALTTSAAGSDQSQCNDGSFTLAGNTPGAGNTGTWSVVSGTATITTPSSPTSGVTGVPAGTSATLRWTITNGISNSTDDVVLTNDELATTSAAGSDIDQEANGSFTLAGNTPVVGTGMWSVVSGTATITTPSSPASGVTGVPVGTSATLRWTITNGTCSSTDDVVLTNVQAVTTSAAGTDQAQCNDGSFTLAGNTPGAGNTGTWSVVSGTATITTPSSPTSGVTGVPAGSSATLRWTITNGITNSTDDVVLTNDELATTAAAGSDINQVSNSSFTLAGNTPVVGTGMWSVVSGTATITTPSSPTSGVTGVPVGTSATLRWTITNGACSSTDDVVLTNNAASLTTAAAGTDQSQCNDGAFTLAGNTPGAGNTGTWSVVSGTATITTPSSPTSGVTGVPAGTSATLRWTITNGITNSTDDVVLTNDELATTAAAGSDINQVSNSSFTLAGNTPVVGTGSWSVVSGTATITTPSSPTSGVTGVPLNTSATLRWTITNGTCSSTDDVILTNSSSTLTTSAAGSDQSQCNDGSFTLAGNTPGAGNTGTWSIVSGTATITTPSSPTSGVTGVPAGTSATLRWTITNGITNSTDDVVLTNDELATTAAAGSDINQVSNSSFTLAGNTPVVGTGSWSVVSGTATITTPSSPTSGVTGVPLNTSATLRWTITNGTCSSTDDVVLTNNAASLTTAAAGTDQSQCNDGSFALAGNIPGAGNTGSWSVVSGTATITTPSSPTSGVTGVPAGSSATLRWTITNGITNSTDDVVLTNDELATTAAAGSDINQVSNSSFTLAGNTPVVGTGMWSVVSGTATITTPSSPTSGVTGVPVGTSATLRWTITNGTCSSTDDVILTNSSSTLTTSAAGSDQSQCNDGSFTLAGNTPGAGNTGTWSVVSGTATITTPSSPTSGVTGVPAGSSATLRWTITNGITNSTDDVVLTNDELATTAAAGSDINQVSNSSFTLAGNTPVVGTGSWSVVSGTATITTPSSPTSGVTGVPLNTSATLRWTITNGACSSTDDVVLTNNAASLTTAAAGTDQSQCNDGSFTLAGNTPGAGNTGSWSVVSGTATITTPSSPTSGVTGVPAGSSATLRWTITNGITNSTDDVVLTNDELATTAAAGSDINQVSNSSFTLAGNTPVVGTGSWSVVSGTATITTPSSPTSGVTGVPVGTSATLRWTITNGTCSSTDDVVLTNTIAQADLSIAKTVDDSTPNVGENIVFSLTVNNSGPDNATGVVVNDLLPSGYTYVSDNGGGNYNSGTGVWTIGNLTNGGNVVLQITATVNATGTYANTATVSGDQNDPDGSDDSDTNTPVPVSQSDLSITKTVDNSTPNVGDNITFTLTVSNTGPSDATGVVVNDLLPSGYTYVSDTPSVGTYNSGTGVWTVGSLTNGANATLSITVSVNATGSYANTATVSGDQNDPDGSDDSDTNTPVPVPQSDLSITKTVDNSTPNVGDNITFTLTVSNTGPSDATGVVVNDLLPSGYTYVSDTPSVGTYNSGTGVWTVGSLTNGANATLAIT